MTDSQLVREIKDGNVELYAELMRRYERRILGFIYQMLRSAGLEALAEDLTQETLYKAFRSLGSFRETDASFATWLYAIARNTVLSELRKQKVAQLPLEHAVDAAASAAGPESDMLRRERAALVREAISRLPEKQRTALILREYDQLDYQEIARVLNQTVASVKSLLFRARTSVREQLAVYFSERTDKPLEMERMNPS